MEMNSYERFMEVLNGNKDATDRIPCVNSVSVATMDFMELYDAYWPQAHKDPEKMAGLGSAAHRQCGLDNLSVPFDMTVEAELMGATIDFHEDTIKWPSIRSFHAEDVSDIKIPKDVSAAGRVPTIIRAIEILKKEFEGKVPVNVYIVPPFTSISSYVVDSIVFLKSVRKSPDKVHEFLKASMGMYKELVGLFADAGADVITFHEMGGSTDNLSPKQFDVFVKPYLKEMIGSVKVPIILNICGSAAMIADKMVECGAKAIAVDERTPIKEAKEKAEKVDPKAVLIGNIPAHGVVHFGPVERIREFVKKAIDDGVDMVAPGCDFWLETPTEHIKAFVDATVEFGSRSR
ncbi:MAG: hypothetical protein H3Z50_02875 [archaeon]|nr:hypothetical protein [archaeon]MCP8306833.1 hypothetical protein [archaeon]